MIYEEEASLQNSTPMENIFRSCKLHRNMCSICHDTWKFKLSLKVDYMELEDTSMAKNLTEHMNNI